MKKSMWKKCLAIVLCLVMLMMTACSNQSSGNSSTTKVAENDKTEAQGGDTQAETEAVVYPDKVTEPITIEFWHTRGSGANGENMTAMIEEWKRSDLQQQHEPAGSCSLSAANQGRFLY